MSERTTIGENFEERKSEAARWLRGEIASAARWLRGKIAIGAPLSRRSPAFLI
jgi:hypothetical protein